MPRGIGKADEKWRFLVTPIDTRAAVSVAKAAPIIRLDFPATPKWSARYSESTKEKI